MTSLRVQRTARPYETELLDLHPAPGKFGPKPYISIGFRWARIWQTPVLLGTLSLRKCPPWAPNRRSLSGEASNYLALFVVSTWLKTSTNNVAEPWLAKAHHLFKAREAREGRGGPPKDSGVSGRASRGHGRPPGNQ